VRISGCNGLCGREHSSERLSVFVASQIVALLAPR
jgi:hypothetical protein